MDPLRRFYTSIGTRTKSPGRTSAAILVAFCLVLGCGRSDSESAGRLDLSSLELEPAQPNAKVEPGNTPPQGGEAASTSSSTLSSNSTSTPTPPTPTPAATVERLSLEQDSLRLGFIKLTDCAPLVIAKEKGFFADEGLQVELVAQPNWKTLLDNVINSELDGAHMLSGQPIAATIGIGTQCNIVTAYTLDLNGNAITVSNQLWEDMQAADPELRVPQPKHPISAHALRKVVDDKAAAGQKLQMAMVFPVSTHNYELRYWLAAAGIHPGFYTASDVGGRTQAEVELSVTPPPMMPATLEAGNIQGYCVGEPWNQQAVAKGIGVPVTTNYDIWQNNPEKVFGVTESWATAHPNTHVALVKALLRAGKWLDEVSPNGEFLNRDEACRILARPNYVGADYDVIKNSMTGYFYFQKSDRRTMPDFNVFFKYHATYPWYSDGVWFLTQMRRWGQIDKPMPAEWYHETVKRIYRPDVYRAAAERLIQEGKFTAADIPSETDGYKPATDAFIDGIKYDGHDPIGYLNSFTIGMKDN